MDALPDTIDALRAAYLEARGRAALAEADAAQAQAERSGDQALIATLKLQIEKLQRDLYGRRSERTSRLLDHLEFQLEEAEASVGEDDLAAEQVAEATGAARITRKAPSRKPFPAHLPRERVVIPAPAVCPCCGSTRLCKLGESVTETAERIPARWKIIQTVRGNSPAGTARRSARRRHRSTPRRAAGWGRTCWPRCCSRSSASTSR